MSRQAKVGSKVGLFGPLFLVFWPVEGLGSGWTTAEQSVMAMGAGGTGATRVEDPAAGVYNPAAALFAPGFRASVGTIIANPVLGASTSRWSTSTEGVSAPPFVHLGYVGEGLGAGLSFGVPFGSRLSWPSDSPLRFDLVKAEVTARRLSAWVGAKLGSLSVAAGPLIDFGSLDLERQIDLVDVEGHTSISTTDTGFGVQLGAFWRLDPRLDLGLSYKSRVKLSLLGYADFDTPPEFRQKTSDQEVAIAVLLPDRLVFGASYRPMDALTITADLEAVFWSTVEELRIDFARAETDDRVQPRDWSPTVAPRLGATYRAIEWLELRAGFFVDPSPTPSRTASASSPDSTRLGLTLGASLSAPSALGLPLELFLDLAYAHLELLGVTGEVEGVGLVKFSGRAELFGLSLRAAL